MKIIANGVELNITEYGQGETALVFLHFWGGSSLTWQGVMAGLSEDFRCVAIDARGAGASAAPASGYNTGDHADDVQAVIKTLELQRYILIGHSMGGKVAQLIASRRPQGLSGVVLVASSPLAPMSISDEQREMMRTAYASEEAARWTVENILTASPIATEAKQQLIQDALRMDPLAVSGWLDSSSKEDLHAVASAIRVPVVVVTGERDQVDPLTVVERQIAVHFPGAPLHILPGKGHLLPLEAASEVADIVRNFAATVR